MMDAVIIIHYSAACICRSSLKNQIKTLSVAIVWLLKIRRQQTIQALQCFGSDDIFTGKKFIHVSAFFSR